MLGLVHMSIPFEPSLVVFYTASPFSLCFGSLVFQVCLTGMKKLAHFHSLASDSWAVHPRQVLQLTALSLISSR